MSKPFSVRMRKTADRKLTNDLFNPVSIRSKVGISVRSDKFASFGPANHETIGVIRLPRNTELGAHFLDREIVDAYCRSLATRTASPFQTVRGSFAEGDPIYPGSKILQKAHTQIAVRDPGCILRLTLVQFP